MPLRAPPGTTPIEQSQTSSPASSSAILKGGEGDRPNSSLLGLRHALSTARFPACPYPSET